MSSIGNPCRFKAVCHKCKKVDQEDRPNLCVALRCPEYLPCPDCGMNRTLHSSETGRSLCKECWKKFPTELATMLAGKKEGDQREVSTGNSQVKKVTITPPGTPPPEFTEDEKGYYRTRWQDYEGHFRNPVAVFNCHMLIIEEINLLHINSDILKNRGELQYERMKERDASVRVMESLTKLLPERESEEIMDDEKSLAMIYESYVQEKGLRQVGKISRLLTPEAIALAPVLPFPIDPKELLQRYGYTLAEAEEAAKGVLDYTKLTSDQLLEFFGFRINEEYALPPDSPLIEFSSLQDEETDADLDDLYKE